MKQSFKDHFSSDSAGYANYRPTYPEELFDFLADSAPSRQCAWDCATGTGQAAIALANHFQQVTASDASTSQISRATPDSRVRYLVCTAEHTPFEPASLDLVTVAQALHWFDIPRFFSECQRLLKTGGITAVWTYNLLQIDDGIDPLIHSFYFGKLQGFWPKERQLVESGYADITFPFQPLAAPEFAMQAEWNLDQLLGYLSTWSAVKKLQAATGENPLADLARQLGPAWGDPVQPRRIRWPLRLLVGRRR